MCQNKASRHAQANLLTAHKRPRLPSAQPASCCHCCSPDPCSHQLFCCCTAGPALPMLQLPFPLLLQALLLPCACVSLDVGSLQVGGGNRLLGVLVGLALVASKAAPVHVRPASNRKHHTCKAHITSTRCWLMCRTELTGEASQVLARHTAAQGACR